MANINALIGERADAEADYGRAMRLYEKLSEDFQDVADYANELARSTFNLAIILYELNKRPEAESAFRRAAALHEKLAADFPTKPQHRHRLGR